MLKRKRSALVLWLCLSMLLMSLGQVPTGYAADAGSQAAGGGLENPGFEAAGTPGNVPGWSLLLGQGKDVSYTVESAVYHGGAQSLKLVDQDTVNNFAVESRKVPVSAGEVYKVESSWYITGGAAQLQIRYYNAAGTQLVGPVIPHDPNFTSVPKNVWQSLSVQAGAPAGAAFLTVVLATGKSTKGTMYVDDIKLSRVLPVANPGFEDPQSGSAIPGWTQIIGAGKNGSVTLDTYAASGTGSMKIDDKDTTSGFAAESVQMAVYGGRQHQVSAAVNIKSGNVQLQIRYYDQSGALLPNATVVNDPNYTGGPVGAWQTIAFQGQAPANAATASIVMASGKSKAGVSNWDDIRLEEIIPEAEASPGPEPTPSPSPTPAGKRFLVNASFEQPLNGGAIPGWKVNAGLAAPSADRAVSGSQSLLVQNTKTTGSGINMESETIEVEEGATYRLSAQLYLDGGNLEGLYVYVYDTDGKLVKSQEAKDFHAYLSALSPKVPEQKWTYIETKFTVQPGGKKLKVSLISGNKKDYRYYLDDVSILKTLSNEGMENPQIDSAVPGWQKFAPSDASSFSITNARAFSGDNSLKLVNTPGSYLNVVSDPIPVEPGDVYTALSKTYIQTGSSGMYVRFFDANKAYIGKQNWSIVSSPTDTWFDQYVKFTVPEEARFAAVMYAGSHNKTYEYYVDDVRILRGDHEVKEVPVPDNSIALIGEDLGVQIQKATLMRGAYGKDGQGRDVVYSVSVGAPAMFTIIDIATEKVSKSYPMPEATGAWSVTTASDGSVYLGAYNKGLLYRYIPQTDELINLGHPLSTKDSVLYPMASGKNGVMYGSTYPTAVLYEYNPATNAFKSYETMSFSASGERWTRVVVYDEATHKIYAGVGNTPRLLEYDLATGGKRDLLPEKFKDIISVYDLNLAGGKLFARKEANNANEYFVIDVQSGELIEMTNGDTGKKSEVFTNVSRGVSPVSPVANKIYFAGLGGELFEYDLNTNVYRSLHVSIEGAAISYSFVELQEEGFPGYSLVGLSGNEGKLYKYNLATGAVRVTDVNVPAEPVIIHDIMKGPDGSIYTSGYLQGNLGKFTPSSGESRYFNGIGQGEGMTATSDRLFIGAYPDAKIYEYDLNKPWNRTNPEQLNPKPIFSMTYNPDIPGYTLQDRPFAMAAAEELNKLFVGTVPKNSLLGGALAVYDYALRSEPDIYWNIVPDQSILSLVYKDGLLYGGTSIHGGQGGTPKATEAKLFVWDVARGEKVFETVPVSGGQAITSLHLGSDGNIWGLSNGALFIFDPATKQIVYSKNEFPDASGRWIDGSMTTGTDGNVYATVAGRFFKVDAETKAVTVLATQARKVAQDDFGRFYLYANPEGPNVYRYAIPELVLKLVDAELTASAAELKAGEQADISIKGLLEKERTTRDLAGALVTYTVSDPETISAEGGKLTAKRAGEAQLTATVTLGGITVQSNSLSVRVVSEANTALAGLSVGAGVLNPAFQSDQLHYTVTVANDKVSTTVTAITYDAGASIQVNGVTVTGGSASPAIVLSTGANDIRIIVTAADGLTTRAYKVTVNREEASVTTPSPTPSPKPTPSPSPESGAKSDVIVNGKWLSDLATMSKETDGEGRKIVRVELDPAKLDASLQAAGDRPAIVIPVEEDADRVIGQLNGQSVKKLAGSGAVLEILTKSAGYKLPMSLLSTELAALQLGAGIPLENIRIRIEIATGTEPIVQALERAAKESGATPIALPVAFTITAEYDGRTAVIDRFADYVERELRIPAATDPNRITTAVVLEPGGKLRHVPTRIVRRDGESYAVIRSKTNSVYALIRNESTFADASSHWARASIDALASRLILEGEPGSAFAPDRYMTRAEFAAALLRTLGMPEAMASVPFTDVPASNWYAGAVAQSAALGLLEGYEDGSFRPEGVVTRAEAFVVLQRALSFAGMNTKQTDTRPLSAFTDASGIPEWAAASAAALFAAGMLEGDDAMRLNPSSDVTRAEGSTLMWRVLEYVRGAGN
ncbi:S-layer homology domain-containing protein [Paenibacillus sp. MBLB4367]|uniref:S-layer homology domain-containing protein n=1 Tax=Paenibacillus sp. MBLB4367 TaxID=3384767 RepID=UPI0039080F46